tara:strand:- start:47 stop:229 length:183 start_codon:yes stop_codon:yes gene_type:complete
MSHSGNEMLKEDAFEEVKQQYIDAGHTEKQAEALAQKFAEDNPDFWIKEEPFNYNAEWRS